MNMPGTVPSPEAMTINKTKSLQKTLVGRTGDTIHI